MVRFMIFRYFTVFLRRLIDFSDKGQDLYYITQLSSIFVTLVHKMTVAPRPFLIYCASPSDF
jgi:hypothetical protein